MLIGESHKLVTENSSIIAIGVSAEHDTQLQHPQRSDSRKIDYSLTFRHSVWHFVRSHSAASAEGAPLMDVANAMRNLKYSLVMEKCAFLLGGRLPSQALSKKTVVNASTYHSTPQIVATKHLHKTDTW
jgi:hypothetical protein